MFNVTTERRLCVILEGIHESLTEMLAEITLQLQDDVQPLGTYSGSHRGRPR